MQRQDQEARKVCILDTNIKIIPRTYNQVCIEIFGNTYSGLTEWDNLSSGSIISINYGRKFNGIILFAGIGLPRKKEPSFRVNPYTLYSLSAGMLFRRGYKQNALWGSLSFSVATLKTYYITQIYHIYGPGGGTLGENYIYRDVDYEIMPGLTYQAQSDNEKFCFRITAGLKLLASCFSGGYSDIASSNLRLYPWLGISIGGGW